MKNNFSKKLIALVMAMVLFVTTFSVVGITASAAEKDKYLFAYFTGNSQSEQQVRLAVSEDGYNFKALNSNAPIVTQTKGTGYTRDPYIFQGNDGAYYILGTDMDCSTGWWGNSSTMVVWKSTDLVNWSEESIIDMDVIAQTTDGDVKRCWAPQAIWDSTKNQYMVYFALATDSEITSGKTILHYCYTSDLMDQSKYTKPEVLFAPADGGNSNDADIWYSESEGLFYLYYKDEGGTNKTYYATSTSVAGPYTASGNLVIDTGEALEGANCYINYNSNKLVMMADAYGNGHFVMAETDLNNFAGFKVKDGGYTINHLSPRHGSVVNITTDEYNALVDKYGLTDTIYESYSFNTTWEITKSDNSELTYFGHEYYDPNQVTAAGQLGPHGAIHVSNGEATMYKAGFILESSTAQTIVKQPEFAISFSFTLDTADAKDATVAAVCLSNTNTDYIILKADGTFAANGQTASTKATINASEHNTFVIIKTASNVMLYQNGVCVANVNTSLNLADSQVFFGIGFSDSNRTNYMQGTYGAIKFSALPLEEYSYYDLENEMNTFETKMQNAQNYSGIDDAYASYVECQKAYDATYYGEKDDILIAGPALSLAYANEYLHSWTHKTASATNKPTYPNNNGDTAATFNNYQGILWGSDMSGDVAPTSGSTTNASISNNELNSGSGIRIYMRYPEVTYLYTGNNDPAFTTGVMFCGRRTTGNDRYLTTVFSNNSNIRLNDVWHTPNAQGSGSNYDLPWVYEQNTTISNNSSSQNGSIPAIQMVNYNAISARNPEKYFATVMQVINPDFGSNYSVSYYPSFGFYINSKYAWRTDDGGNFASAYSRPLNVINYKPLIDKINEVAPKLSAYTNYNIADYSEGGAQSFVNALAKAQDFDPNSYFTSADKNDVGGCANQIKNLIDSLNSAAVGAKDSTPYANLRATIDEYSEIQNDACFKDSNWNDLRAAVADCRAEMAKVYASAYTASDSTINTLVNAVDSAYNTLISDLKHDYVKYESDNGTLAQFNCNANFSQHTHVKTADVSVYNALATVYKTLDFNAYTDEGSVIKEAKKVFDSMKTTAVAYGDQQTFVDSCINALITAINTSVENTLNQYKVTFVVDNNGAKSTIKDAELYSYGSVVPLNAGAGLKPYKWTVESQGTTQTVSNFSNEYAVRIQADTVVTAYISDNQVSADTVAVTIVNQIGNPVYKLSVDSNKSITVDASADTATTDGVVTIDGVDYTLPVMPFHNVDAFTVKGQNYTGAYTTTVGAVAKDGTLVIAAKSNVADSTYRITLNGVEVYAGAEYDEDCTVTANGAYAIAIEQNGIYSVVAYGSSYEFYANRPMNFYTVSEVNGTYMANNTQITDPVAIHSLNNNLPFSYSASVTKNGTMYVYSAFSTNVPSGVTIVEAGTIYTLNNYDNDSFTIDAAGVFKQASKSQVAMSNQYYLGIVLPPASMGTLSARGYVKYQYQYNGDTIDAIAYGDICVAK